MEVGSKMKKFLGAVVVWAIVFGPGATPVQAYIDPGTGSSLLSSLGIILGIVCTGIAIGFAQLKHVGRLLITKLSHRKHKRKDTGKNDNSLDSTRHG